MTSVFLAPTRQPVMHEPHSVHVVRRGPAPPKYGSSTSRPGTGPDRVAEQHADRRLAERVADPEVVRRLAHHLLDRALARRW